MEFKSPSESQKLPFTRPRPMSMTSNRPGTAITTNTLASSKNRMHDRRPEIDMEEDRKKKRNKAKYEDKLIQIAIKKIQNEKAYEVLIKMGEANEICQILKLDITYRVFASANGTIKC